MLIQMLMLSEAAERSTGLWEEIDIAGRKKHREHKGPPLGVGGGVLLIIFPLEP